MTGIAMEVNGVQVVDTFAEAFDIKATRLIVTALNQEWVEIAAAQATGFATSVIACDCEAAIERRLASNETPDGRPGASLLFFAFSRDALAKAMQNRVGQCLLTCPTTACFNGLTGDAGKEISVGGAIRYFGDGFQISKKLGKRRYWRIPVMDGEFLCEDQFGTVSGVAGGNLILCGESQEQTLAAAQAAVRAMDTIPDVALPFPGGIVRSGSKVGSKYPKLKASTNDAFCPTLRAQRPTELPAGAEAAYEIVIDGLSFSAVQQAMKAGLLAAAASPGVLNISAGNYGGKLGKHHFHLRDLQ